MIKAMTVQEVADNWPRVKELIDRVLERFDFGSDDADILRQLAIGEREIWSINDLDGIVVVQICNLPEFSVLDIPVVSGDNMDNWLPDLIDQLIRYAKAVGCKYIDQSGRLGWTKVLKPYGFKVVSYEMRLEV